ncbi:MAG: imidazole glycerol phosphate synthase subunit HisF [Lentisphaerales bacterium]|nr:MAG: imidazole glycerol phosphate synthase subunit HisF [Lentisphaerales bacterium]
MSVVRVIPCLDMKDGRVVKGVHFVDLKDAADPVQAARAYSAGGADEIAFLDITATVENRRTMFDVLKNVADAVSVPLTVGGGIKSCSDIESALKSGASHVSISSAAFRDSAMVKQAVGEFGASTIVIAIDADANDACPSSREVFIDGGRTATGKDAVEFAKEMAGLGVGQILPTSKATDGTKAGFDLHLTRAIADATGLPVIASGGAGTLNHFLEAVTEGHAQAVLGASVFHFGILTIGQVKEHLGKHGIEVVAKRGGSGINES